MYGDQYGEFVCGYWDSKGLRAYNYISYFILGLKKKQVGTKHLIQSSHFFYLSQENRMKKVEAGTSAKQHENELNVKLKSIYCT